MIYLNIKYKLNMTEFTNPRQFNFHFIQHSLYFFNIQFSKNYLERKKL